jgi:hypothetical protein
MKIIFQIPKKYALKMLSKPYRDPGKRKSKFSVKAFAAEMKPTSHIEH